MSIDVLMPALSPTMEEGTLAKWHVKKGDKVSSGDVIAEIETDKATMEVEAVDEGVIEDILVAEGSEGVKVNTPIARLSGEDAGSAPPPAKAAAPKAEAAKSEAPKADAVKAEAPKAQAEQPAKAAGTLGELPELAQRHAVLAPALLVVGEVAAFATQLHWFGCTPLTNADAGCANLALARAA